MPLKYLIHFNLKPEKLSTVGIKISNKNSPKVKSINASHLYPLAMKKHCGHVCQLAIQESAYLVMSFFTRRIKLCKLQHL